MPNRSGNWILAVPSFWGLSAWGLSLFAYLFIDIGWQASNPDALAVLWAMPTCFAVSLLFFGTVTRSVFNHHYDGIFPKVRMSGIVLLHMVGVAASLLFISDVNRSGYLNGDFVSLLLTDPLQIRRVPVAEMPRGLYLGYIGWLAVFLSGTQAALFRKGRRLHFMLFLIQIAANLVFLSKIRPIAVVFLFVLPYLILHRKRFSLGKLALAAGALAAFIIWFFIEWSDATGKTFALDIGYSPAVETFLLYLTSGPAYLSHIVAVEFPDMEFVRTLRPFYTLSAIVVGTAPPPSAITQFYDLPITTNVGTALEPWYRDFGAIGVLLGLVVLSVGVDLIAYWGLLFRRTTGLLITVMMCLCSALAFFAPRLTTGPVVGALMLFAIHASVVALMSLFKRQRDEPKSRVTPALRDQLPIRSAGVTSSVGEPDPV